MRDVTKTQCLPSVEPVAPDKRVSTRKRRGSMKRRAMVRMLTGTMMLAPLLTSAHPLIMRAIGVESDPTSYNENSAGTGWYLGPESHKGTEYVDTFNNWSDIKYYLNYMGLTDTFNN